MRRKFTDDNKHDRGDVGGKSNPRQVRGRLHFGQLTQSKKRGASMRSDWRAPQKILLLVGFMLLAFWTAIWAISVKKNHLAIGKLSYIPCMPFLGIDFDINYYATRTWRAGHDPYQGYLRKGLGQLEGVCKYDHPPLVLALFAWCLLVPHKAAVILWICAQAFVLTLAVFLCGRSRYQLDLLKVPRTLLLAATLLSYPVVAEMERGNWNTLVLLFLILAVAALRGRSLLCDILAGTFAAIAAWIKIYPALLLLGLLALRRWRAAGFCAIALLLIASVNVRGVLEFAANIKESAILTPDYLGSFAPWSHTVSGSWLLFCSMVHLPWLERLPGTVGWGLLVFPLVLWVSYRVAKLPNPSRLIYPYFLWLTAAATYLPPIANDYSLIFLPLAALAVWDRRDKGIIHVLMVLMLIWWQPIWLPSSSKFLWCSKLASLGVVALILVSRGSEQYRIEAQGERMETASLV
jgi:hypothetical protein